MTAGKRTGTDQPLTEHDVAERLDHAALRLLRIMQDVRLNHPELLGPVRGSRFLTNAVNALAYELKHPEWNISPVPLREESQAGEQSGGTVYRSPSAVRCPTCLAEPGSPCQRLAGGVMTAGWHRSREHVPA